MSDLIRCDIKVTDKLKSCDLKYKIKISGPDLYTFISEIAKAFNFKLCSSVQDNLKDLDKVDCGFFYKKHNKSDIIKNSLLGQKLLKTNLYDILIEILDKMNGINPDFQYYIQFIDDKKFEIHQVYLKFDIKEYNEYLEREAKLVELYPCRYNGGWACDDRGKKMPDGEILTCDNCRFYRKSEDFIKDNNFDYVINWDAPIRHNDDWKEEVKFF